MEHPGGPADIPCMLDLDPSLLGEDDSWRVVLGAYHSSQSLQIQQNPESDGWLPRLRSVEGIEGEALSRAHGQLIALGFLKFELRGREEGMCYQLSQLGKRTAEQGSQSSEEIEESSSDDELSVSAHDHDHEPMSGAA